MWRCPHEWIMALDKGDRSKILPTRRQEIPRLAPHIRGTWVNISWLGPSHTQWTGEIPCERKCSIMPLGLDRVTWCWAPNLKGTETIVLAVQGPRSLLNCASQDSNQVSLVWSTPKIHKYRANPAHSNWKALSKLFWICGRLCLSPYQLWRDLYHWNNSIWFLCSARLDWQGPGNPLRWKFRNKEIRFFGKGINLGGQWSWNEDAWATQGIISMYHTAPSDETAGRTIGSLPTHLIESFTFSLCYYNQSNCFISRPPSYTTNSNVSCYVPNPLGIRLLILRKEVFVENSTALTTVAFKLMTTDKL